MKKRILLNVIGSVIICVIISLAARFLQNFWHDRYFPSVELFEDATAKEQLVLEDSGYYVIRRNDKTIFGYPKQKGGETYVWDEFPFQPQNCKHRLRSLTDSSFLLPNKGGIMRVINCIQIHDKNMIFMKFTVFSDSKTYVIMDKDKRIKKEVSLSDNKKEDYYVFFVQDASDDIIFYINGDQYTIKNNKCFLSEKDAKGTVLCRGAGSVDTSQNRE